MQKTLIALSLLAATGGLAHAQSSVTVYGTFDGSVRNQTNTTATGDNKLSVGSNGIYLANRLGFTGNEDLGGGNHVKFTLETGFNPGTGGLDTPAGVLFNRSAWVGLDGQWGSLRAGRQYTVAFQVAKDYEPLTYRYISLIPVGGGAGTTLPAAATSAGLGASATSGPRLNNDVQYSGSFGALTVMGELAAGEQAGSVRNGAAQALGLKYSDGPVYLGAAYTQKKTIAGFDNKSATVGGGYKFGALAAKLGYAQERQASAAAGTYRNKVTWGGLVYSLSAQVELIGAWYNTRYSNVVSGKRDLFIASASYALSKRSRLYAEIDRNKYSGALIPATRQSGQTGLTLGMNHTF